jgi:hypothetical protein
MMYKPTLSSYLRTTVAELQKKKEPGPYVTISREPGCEGYRVGDLLMEKLNRLDELKRWRVFKKELLKQLAEDTGVTEEIIEQERHAIPSIVRDFFKGMGTGIIPNGIEIRSKITTMVRSVAFEGHSVIIGQGGTAATADLANGLSIRLEAPREWRIVRICRRDNISRDEAIRRMNEEEESRIHLRRLYEQTNPRLPAFNLSIDNSVFTAEQIADIILNAMRLKAMMTAH